MDADQNTHNPNTRNQHTAVATGALALAGCLWGTGFLFGKIAFAEMSVSEDCVWRLTIGSLILAPFYFLRPGKQFSGRDWQLVLVAGLVGVPVLFLIQFKGLQLTTVSHASLMVGMLPVLVAVSSVLFFHEQLRAAEWMGLALSAVGAVLIAISKRAQSGPQATVQGDALVLASLIAVVITILLTKRLMHDYDPLRVTVTIILSGTGMLLVWFVLTQHLRFSFSRHTWFAVVAQGVLATAIAYVSWNWGLARVPASRAAVFLNMEPVVGTLLGVLVLKERLGALAIVGGVLIIGAAVYFSRRGSEG